MEQFRNLFTTAAPKKMSFSQLLIKAVISNFYLEKKIPNNYLLASGTNLRKLENKNEIKKIVKKLRKSKKQDQVRFIAKYLLGLSIDIKFTNNIKDINVHNGICIEYLIDKSGMERNDILKIIAELDLELFKEFIDLQLEKFEKEGVILPEEKVKIVKISDGKYNMNLYCNDCIKNSDNSCKRDGSKNCEFSETICDSVGNNNLKELPYVLESSFLKSIEINLKLNEIGKKRNQIENIFNYYKIKNR